MGSNSSGAPCPPPTPRITITPRFKLTKPATEIEMPPLGYADPNLTSYGVFAGLKQEGVIPAPVRFMVALPTPYGMVAAACLPEDQLGFESVYKHALMGELERVCAGIPHDQLAVQWDIPCEVMIMEGEMPTPFADDELLGQVASRVAEAGNSIPAGAELGFHYCYGDYLGERFKEPDDLGVCVQIANAVAERLDHHVDFIHMPVPGLSADPAFLRSAQRSCARRHRTIPGPGAFQGWSRRYPVEDCSGPSGYTKRPAFWGQH